MIRVAIRQSALAVTLACFSLAGFAQSHKELAQRAYGLHQNAVDNIAKVTAAQTMQQLMQGMGAALGKVPQDKREALSKELEPELKKFHQDLESTLRERNQKLAPAVLLPMFDEKYTDEELKQIIAWMESPVSRKYQVTGNEMITALQQKLVAETKATVEPKIRALQEKVQAKLSGAAASTPNTKKP